MTNVWDKDGPWDSIGLVSERLSSTTGLAGRSSQGSIFELQTRAQKNKIILTKNANLTFVDEGFGLRCVGNAFLCLECPSDAGKR